LFTSISRTTALTDRPLGQGTEARAVKEIVVNDEREICHVTSVAQMMCFIDAVSAGPRD
jgi:hypothetical protein